MASIREGLSVFVHVLYIAFRLLYSRIVTTWGMLRSSLDTRHYLRPGIVIAFNEGFVWLDSRDVVRSYHFQQAVWGEYAVRPMKYVSVSYICIFIMFRGVRKNIT